MRYLCFLILFASSASAQNLQAYGEALARAQPHIYGVQPDDNPRTILVPVPSCCYNILSGYEPSVGLVEVPGRQLNSPLSTALGFDQVPLPQNAPVYIAPRYGYGR